MYLNKNGNSQWAGEGYGGIGKGVNGDKDESESLNVCLIVLWFLNYVTILAIKIHK